MCEIVKELMKNIDDYKQELFKACKAEKGLQRLLHTINEALSIHDIKNSKVDLKIQGKFKRMSEFRIRDEEHGRRYSGKVFFYEKSIIYTELKDAAHLEYCGFFDISLLEIVYSKRATEFVLERDSSTKKFVRFRSNDHNLIVDWLTLLEETLKETIQNTAESQIRKHGDQYELTQLNIPDSLIALDDPELVGYKPK
jgi:hypothetical protein